MKTEVREGEGNTVTLKIEAGPEDLKDIIDQTYKDLGSRMSVPGFRKGRVPKQVIDSHIGADSVRMQALEKGLPTLYFMGVQESGIFPVDDPEIEILDADDNGGVVFEATVEVKPEIEVKDYKGIVVDRPETEVTDDDLQRALDSARERFATLEVVEGRSVQEGDFVMVDYKVFADGEPIEGSSGTDRLVEIGTGDFLPGFDEQLVGSKKGDILDVTVTFPPDYGERDLAGKPGTYRTIVKEIKIKILPELDDDLAKQISQFETLDEFSEDLKEKIGKMKEAAGERQVRENAIQALSDRTYVDVPEKMIERQVEQEVEQFAEELGSRGITLDDYLKAMKGTRHQLEKAFREQVTDALKAELVIDAVASAEGIEISDEEAENYITERVTASGGDPEKSLKEMRREGRIPLVKANMRLTRAIDFIAENAVFADKPKGEEPAGEEGAAAPASKEDDTAGDEAALEAEETNSPEKSGSDEVSVGEEGTDDSPDGEREEPEEG